MTDAEIREAILKHYAHGPFDQMFPKEKKIPQQLFSVYDVKHGEWEVMNTWAITSDGALLIPDWEKGFKATRPYGNFIVQFRDGRWIQY